MSPPDLAPADLAPADLEPPVPPAGEEIHLPGPTYLPVFLAVGITFSIVGLTISIYMSIVGVILTVTLIARWVLDTRRDIAHLPPR